MEDVRLFSSELITTSDGSHTLKLKGYDEQYHSINGALQESRHVFLEAGLQYFKPLHNPLFVLEVGMGTGLNALLTTQIALNYKTRILYDALEPFPLDRQLVKQLNYPDLVHESWGKEAFDAIHGAGNLKYVNFRDYFFIRCFREKIQEMDLEAQRYHLVYFDAFGPDTQAELWEQSIFDKIKLCMKPGGVLVTYCAKGAVKRALKAAGFKIEELAGPPGKRQMTRAVKP